MIRGATEKNQPQSIKYLRLWYHRFTKPLRGVIVVKNKSIIFAGLLSLFCLNSSAAASNYESRIGLRFNLGAMPFARLSLHPELVKATVDRNNNAVAVNTDGLLETHAGVALPLELGVTYGVTNALQLGTSLVYSPNLGNFAGTKASISQFAAGLTLRYFINMSEAVKGYVAETLYLGFSPTVLQPKFDLGLQWDVSDMVALYVENGLLPFAVTFAGPFEVNVAANVNVGIQLHF